jgi:hypothetical protein
LLCIILKHWKVLVWYINYIVSNINLYIYKNKTVNYYEIFDLFYEFTKCFYFFKQTCTDNDCYNESSYFIHYNYFLLIFYFSQSDDLLFFVNCCVVWSIFIFHLEIIQIIIFLNVYYLLILCLVLSIYIHLINI